MKIIYISIEVKSRELLSKLFFIADNINENFTFFIGDKLSIKRATKFFGKGIYFYKSINKNDTDHISSVKNKKNIYVSLDEEGGYVQSNSKYLDSFLQFRSSFKNMSLVDRVYTWGAFDYKGWKERYKKYSGKIIKTGSPRLDLWRKDVYSKIFKEEILSLRRKFGKFFFIPSTFYSSYSDLSLALNNERKIRNNKNILPLKRRIEEKKYAFYLFKVFVKLVKNLSKDFPDHKIVIKPHPTENVNNWGREININKYKNIVIDNNCDVAAYIEASKCVIYNSSTAGLQSIVMGKKSIVFNGLKKDKSFRNFPNQCTIQFNDYKLLKRELNKKFSKKSNSKSLAKIKKRLFISNKSCSKKIFEDLKKISRKQKSEINIDNPKIKFLSIFFISKDYIYFIVNKILSIFKNKKDLPANTYYKKMRDGISLNEINTFFTKLEINSKIKIHRFGKNGFVIKKL